MQLGSFWGSFWQYGVEAVSSAFCGQRGDEEFKIQGSTVLVLLDELGADFIGLCEIVCGQSFGEVLEDAVSLEDFNICIFSWWRQ